MLLLLVSGIGCRLVIADVGTCLVVVCCCFVILLLPMLLKVVLVARAVSGAAGHADHANATVSVAALAGGATGCWLLVAGEVDAGDA